MDKEKLIEFINRQIVLEEKLIKQELMPDDQYYLLLEYKNGYIRAMHDVLYELKETKYKGKRK